MDARDTRPIYSEMPAHILPVWEEVGPKIQQLLQDAYDRVHVLAGDRPRAEVVNEALSIVSQLVAFGGVQVILRMVQEKAAPVEIAYPIVAQDIVNRMCHSLELLAAADAAKTAAKQ